MEKIELTPADNYFPLLNAYRYSANLTERLKLCSKKMVIEVHRAIDHYILEYKKALKNNDAISVAANFHILIDAEIEQMLQEPGNKPTCKKGCSFCCLYNVDVNLEEAQLMLEYAKEKNIAIDWEKVKAQALHPDADTWYNQTPAQRRCIFSGPDGSCQVYDHRPGSCRTYFSISPAEMCDGEKYPDGKVERVSNVYMEAIDAGMQNGSAANGNIPTMLLQAKNIK